MLHIKWFFQATETEQPNKALTASPTPTRSNYSLTFSQFSYPNADVPKAGSPPYGNKYIDQSTSSNRGHGARQHISDKFSKTKQHLLYMIKLQSEQ